MKLTVDAAFKMIKYLNNNLSIIDNDVATLSLYITEELRKEEDRPEFSLGYSIESRDDICDKILKIKHAINQFNVTTVVCDEMTVDQAIVKLSMLNTKSMMLERLRRSRDSVRQKTLGNGPIEYQYQNFDIEYVKEEYDKITNQIFELQSKINLVNATYEIEVDI